MSDETESPTVNEPTVISGVVHPLGSYGIGSGKDQDWAAQFFFETWRDADGALHSGKLVIRRKMPHAQVAEFVSQIHPHQILSVRVVLTESNTADLVEILDPSLDDDDLIQRAAELQEPKTYTHDRFGALTLDRRLDEYRGIASWLGNKIRLHLDAAEIATLALALQTAIELWDDQQGWNQRVQDYAVHNLLFLKNDNWLEDDEAELTADEFKLRIKLDTISVQPNGTFVFWYYDGDMFFSHMIQISGNLADGPTHAGIPG